MAIEIKSHTEYESALKRIDELWGVESNTGEGAEYDALFEAVEKYEVEHYPMDEPDSYGAVEYHLDRLNLSIDELSLSNDEKVLLKECIAQSRLIPERLLLKLSNRLDTPRKLLGRADTSQQTLLSHYQIR